MFKRRRYAFLFAMLVASLVLPEARAQQPEEVSDPSSAEALEEQMQTAAPDFGAPVDEAWDSQTRTFETDVPGVLASVVYPEPVSPARPRSAIASWPSKTSPSELFRR
jgi:hypothetical protein